jgi:hypothetical protein
MLGVRGVAVTALLVGSYLVAASNQMSAGPPTPGADRMSSTGLRPLAPEPSPVEALPPAVADRSSVLPASLPAPAEPREVVDT